jgi:hypothetical protein
VVIVQVDEPGVGVVALHFCVPVADVGPFLEEDPVEPSHFAAGLGSAGPCLFHGGAGGLAGSMPQAGFAAGSVVGEDTFGCDPYRVEPSCDSSPEPGCGAYFLI